MADKKNACSTLIFGHMRYILECEKHDEIAPTYSGSCAIVCNCAIVIRIKKENGR